MARTKPKKLPKLHESLAQTLQNAERVGILHHGYLLYGAPGSGKRWILEQFLKLIKRNPTNDSDIITLEATEESSIEEMRTFTTTFQSTSLSGKSKMAFIFEADQLSIQAQNGLLKTLEEPPRNHYLFLTTSNVYKVPETIRSRCIQLFIPRISDTELRQWLAEVLGPDINLQYAVQCSFGNIRTAFESAQDSTSSINETEHQIDRLLTKPSDIFSIVQRGTKQENIEFIEQKRSVWIRQLRHKLRNLTKQSHAQSIVYILRKLIELDTTKSTNLILQVENIWFYNPVRER